MESKSEMGNYNLLSSSNMINGQTILAGTKAAKKRGRGEGGRKQLSEEDKTALAIKKKF